jgi:serine O-acetyltransferase
VYKAGKNLSVYQGVTLGNKGTGSRSVTNPTIGDNVSICANATVIGGVKIGNNVIIGAGSVVTKDIPDNYIAYGNPMILKKRQ